MVKSAVRTRRAIPFLVLVTLASGAVVTANASVARAAAAKAATKAATKAAIMTAVTTAAATKTPATKTAATKKKATKAPNRHAPVELYAVNSKETLQLRLRDDKGRPLRGVQKRFDTLMRCHHTKKAHPMNPRLVRMLYQVENITQVGASRWSRAIAIRRWRRIPAAPTCRGWRATSGWWA